MMLQKRRVTLFAILALLVSAALVVAHGGGIDSYGGHNDRSAGNYHFHQGPLAGQTFPSKTAAIAALERAADPARTSTARALVERDAPDAGVQALVALLVRKGVITRAEYEAELARR